MKFSCTYRYPVASLPPSSDFYKLLESVWQTISSNNQKIGMFGKEDDTNRPTRNRPSCRGCSSMGACSKGKVSGDCSLAAGVRKLSSEQKGGPAFRARAAGASHYLYAMLLVMSLGSHCCWCCCQQSQPLWLEGYSLQKEYEFGKIKLQSESAAKTVTKSSKHSIARRKKCSELLCALSMQECSNASFYRNK